MSFQSDLKGAAANDNTAQHEWLYSRSKTYAYEMLCLNECDKKNTSGKLTVAKFSLPQEWKMFVFFR